MILPDQVSPPRIAVSDVPPSRVDDVDVLALPLLPGPTLGPGAAELLEDLPAGPDLFAVLEAAGATGAVGDVVTVPEPGLDGVALLLLVGVGDASPTELRRAAAATARAVRGREVLATSLAALSDDAGLRAVAEGLVLGSFEFHMRSAGARTRPVARVVLAGVHDPDSRRPALARAVAVAGAGWHSRVLALTPANVKSPAWLADQAEQLARRNGLTFRSWDHEELASGGFGGIVAVGQGSARPPRLVQLEYSPERSARASRKPAHVVLVGKGITFDTGGLSIKPKDNMALMKRDMTGAGAVLAVMGALRDVACPVRVTALLPLAENSVGAASMRPGDVVRHYGGRTSEVTNTDAEGRLVMADALAYAVDTLGPDLLVDVATLTGAMKIALGQRTGGMFATDDALAESLRASSLAAGEPLWRMPLEPEYEERLSSPVADADNAAGGPGALTAALFLQHFTGGLPWAHLDVASVGDSPEDAYEWTKGATGFGARALLHWLEMRDPLTGVG